MLSTGFVADPEAALVLEANTEPEAFSGDGVTAEMTGLGMEDSSDWVWMVTDESSADLNGDTVSGDTPSGIWI